MVWQSGRGELRGEALEKELSEELDPVTMPQQQYEEDAGIREKNTLLVDEGDADIKYKTMNWWQAAMIMIAETVSLGVLSLPSVLANIGLVPGIILIISLGLIASYTGYTIFQFKMAHPHVANMADAGEVLFGAFGREFFGAALVILLIFAASSHILTFSIALNIISEHTTCTIVWAVVALVVFFCFSIPRTMKRVSYFSIAAFISVVSACLITMIALGIQRPDPVVQATVTGVKFYSSFISVANIVFAYQGHVAFFSFISELKDPRDFPKALAALQIFDISLYLTVAVVVYRYAGTDVASPALGSTSKLISRIAYGVALPTIVIAAVIYIHVAAKYVYLRIFRGTRHMSANSFLALGSWIGIIAVISVIAFVIAESIPNFNALLSLIASLFASWFTYALSGMFWLSINPNFGIVALGVAICGIGLYASGVEMAKGDGSSWSCADNSS
ncbi:amino acid transporter [Delphinella strobiligena]|nr:amino acid transporter [Delphinella strobiligena]